MRSGQHSKRGRSRQRSSSGGGGSGSGGGNPLSRIYESNGPDVKVRGTAQTVAEKYLQLGRDAQSSSDIVMAESYYQHAEHYLRIVAAAQAYQQQMQPQQYRRPGEDMDDDEGDEAQEQASIENRNQPQSAEQPDMGADQPFEAERVAQQNYRQQRDYRDRDQQGGQSNSNRDQQGGQSSGNRDQQAGQPYSSRDRNRSRWQDRRDQPQNANGETRLVAPQPRGEDQPREVAPAPAPKVEAVADSGQWEAPSFLRRPAPMPAPAETNEASAATETPPPARRTRKPRREASEPAADQAVPVPLAPRTTD